MSERNFPSFSIGKFIRDKLLSGKCAICRERADAENVCPACDAALDVAERSIPVFTVTGRDGKLIKCAAAFTYEYDIVKKLVSILKKKYDKKLFMYSARRMLKAQASLGVKGKIMYVNVPRSSQGLRTHGFDQGRLLAECLSKMSDNAVYANIVARRPFSGEQKKLSASERAENIRGKFRIKTIRTKLAGSAENIIIVDDVLTTGSSASEAFAVIAAAFPHAKIYGLFLSCTPRSVIRYKE